MYVVILSSQLGCASRFSVFSICDCGRGVGHAVYADSLVFVFDSLLQSCFHPIRFSSCGSRWRLTTLVYKAPLRFTSRRTPPVLFLHTRAHVVSLYRKHPAIRLYYTGVRGTLHDVPFHPVAQYTRDTRLTRYTQTVLTRPLSLASMSPSQTMDATAAGLPESRVLIIGTGGTICMQEGPDGLAPSEDFLETAMAPRPSFNDMSGLDGSFSHTHATT